MQSSPRKNNQLGTDAKCLATKDWFPVINPKFSYQLIQGRSRYEYSVLIHAITGHNHLAYHEFKQGKVSSPQCTLCSIEGSEMTTKHLFTECEKFALLRLNIFGEHNPSVPFSLSVDQIVRFLRETNVGWLPTSEG